MTSSGTKRKHQEKALTAKAQDGTLKVQILRRNERDKPMLSKSSEESAETSRWRAVSYTASDSPPKPRPNRKHVPIFYEPQFRQPIKRGSRTSDRHKSQTDEHLILSTGGRGLYSSSSTEEPEVAPLKNLIGSGHPLNLVSVKPEDISEQMGKTSSLARNKSDAVGLLEEQLKPHGLQSAFPSSTSSESLFVDNTVRLSVLHRLASSSTSYRFAPHSLPTTSNEQNYSKKSADSDAAKLTKYKCGSFSALQTAIDHAQRIVNVKKRKVGNSSSNARFYEFKASEMVQNKEISTTVLQSELNIPCTITSQETLVFKGIQSCLADRNSEEIETTCRFTTNDERSTTNVITTLGSPPRSPPSISNTLSDESISFMDLSNTDSEFDRLGSVAQLIGQSSEVTKHLTISPLLNMTSRLEIQKALKGKKNIDAPNLAASPENVRRTLASTSMTSKTDERNCGDVDLGSPPSGPPAFTIGNSLMGGGIELQPAATNVNSHIFDWRLHKSASSNGDDAISNAATFRTGLRKQLEQKPVSSQNSTDK